MHSAPAINKVKQVGLLCVSDKFGDIRRSEASIQSPNGGPSARFFISNRLVVEELEDASYVVSYVVHFSSDRIGYITEVPHQIYNISLY